MRQPQFVNTVGTQYICSPCEDSLCAQGPSLNTCVGLARGRVHQVSDTDNTISETIHPSLWFIVEGPLAEHSWIPPFDHSLRSDEWTAQAAQPSNLRVPAVYIDNLLIAGHRSLNDKPIEAVKEIWKTSRGKTASAG